MFLSNLARKKCLDWVKTAIYADRIHPTRLKQTISRGNVALIRCNVISSVLITQIIQEVLYSIFF